MPSKMENVMEKWCGVGGGSTQKWDRVDEWDTFQLIENKYNSERFDVYMYLYSKWIEWQRETGEQAINGKVDIGLDLVCIKMNIIKFHASNHPQPAIPPNLVEYRNFFLTIFQ